MKQRETNPTVKGAVGTTRPKSSVLPEGFSWIQAPIPMAVHAHVKNMAGLSNMSLKEYLAWFLRTARPRTDENLSQDMPNLTAQTTFPDPGCSASRSGEVAVLESPNELEREQPHENDHH